MGRKQEITNVQQLLTGARLVTLVGAGGWGKTRLAQAVASAVAAQSDGGAGWVELSHVNDPAFVLDLLVGSGRTAERHRTRRATIDWRYDLLSPQERLLLQRLTVFAAGAVLTSHRARTFDILSCSAYTVGASGAPRDHLGAMLAVRREKLRAFVSVKRSS